MNIYIDTCVLPRSQLETGRVYRERFGTSLGFELLMMFDLKDFEENLKQTFPCLRKGPFCSTSRSGGWSIPRPGAAPPGRRACTTSA